MTTKELLSIHTNNLCRERWFLMRQDIEVVQQYKPAQHGSVPQRYVVGA